MIQRFTWRWERSGFPSVLVWLFLAFLLLLLVARGRAISSTLHLRATLSGHFLLLTLAAAHHLLLMILSAHPHLLHLLLIHRILFATSGCVAGVHFRGVSAHVLPVALIFGLQLVCVCSRLSCSSALPMTFSHIGAVIFRFSCSGSCSLALALRQVPGFVSSFRSRGSAGSPDFLCALTLSRPFSPVE
jgi:hypothetical protein